MTRNYRQLPVEGGFQLIASKKKKKKEREREQERDDDNNDETLSPTTTRN